MSSSTHQIAVKAVDQTAGAFGSIAARARSAGASMRRMLGGALTAAGAYIGVSAIKNAIGELGKLSDLSMKTGVSVQDLTQSLTAFQTMGLDLDIGRLAKSFQYMEKSTGRRGMAGMVETLDEIAKIEDPLKRGNALMRDFGRAGMEFQPLINGGREAVSAFRELASVMPGVSDAAANAGDEVADAMNIAATGFKSIWQQAVAKVCMLWADDLPGGVRAGTLNMINWFEVSLKKMWNALVGWGAQVGNFFSALGTIVSGGDWDATWNEFSEVNAEIEREMDAKIAANEKARQDYLAKLRSMDVDANANALSKIKAAGSAAGEAMVAKAKNIRNELVLGGSNDALKMAIMGPSLDQSKQQTKLLEQIASNTEKTADNTEAGESEIAVGSE